MEQDVRSTRIEDSILGEMFRHCVVVYNNHRHPYNIIED